MFIGLLDLFFRMDTTVDFNGEFCSLTVEIRYETFHNLLSPEFDPTELAIVKIFPHFCFGRGHGLPQRARIGQFFV